MILNGLKTSSGAYGDEVLTVKFNDRLNQNGTYSNEEEFIYHEDYSWDLEINHFFNSIKEKVSPILGSSDDAVELMEVIEKIYNN